MNRGTTAATALLALFLGGIIYVLWRQDSLIMFRWFDALHLRAQVHSIRIYAEPYAAVLPRWVIFSLPQALWLFSGVLLLSSIWGNDTHNGMQLWLVILLTMAFGIECLQYLHWVPGTFDEVDVGLLIAGCALGFPVIKFSCDRERRT